MNWLSEYGTSVLQVVLFMATAASGIIGFVAKSKKDKTKFTHFEWTLVGIIAFTLTCSIALEFVKAQKAQASSEKQRAMTQQLLAEIENTRYRFSTITVSPTYDFQEKSIPEAFVPFYSSGKSAFFMGDNVVRVMGKANLFNILDLLDTTKPSKDGQGKPIGGFVFELWQAKAIMVFPHPETKTMRVVFKDIPANQIRRTRNFNNALDMINKSCSITQGSDKIAPFIKNIYIETDAGVGVQADFTYYNQVNSLSGPLREVTDPYNP